MTLILIFTLQTLAEPILPQAISSTSQTIRSDEMSGVKLNDFADFEKKWKLVTVRFRRDTGEMRFTYANDSAYEALMKSSTDYPKGAVFAKIGFKTDQDPGFPSSVVPTQSRRYQFMIRDQAKFSKTDGWGYALFDQDGFVFPENTETQTAACAACHRIVPERGYVFSEYLEMAPKKGAPKIKIPENHFTQKIKFEDVSVQKLPTDIQKLIPQMYKKVRVLKHEISQFLFQGTLDEIKPALSEESVGSKKPALILSTDQKSYTLVFIENLEIKCEQDGKSGYFIKSVTNSPTQKFVAYETRYCWTH
ncbi:MAG: cytochrome P460 family protein [Bdellovibrionaceae bacterium]|nr:cytochrome P460 family protein [Pseudobdellovibrionaceae bacterium]